MCHPRQAARLDLGTGKDRMLCLQEGWYPSRSAATSLPVSGLEAQAAMGAGGVMTHRSTGLGFSHHAGSPADSPVGLCLKALLFQLARALVWQLLTDSQGYLPSAGPQQGEIAFHTNTAREAHYASYFTRPGVFSFRPGASLGGREAEHTQGGTGLAQGHISACGD